MRPIHKFILYVVHNWKNELNEAYSEGAIKKFIEKFRDEADDLNIQITDEQLKVYIQRFDVLKNSPKVTEKDLNKWSIGQLIRLVTTSKGAETEEEADTPDVVYNDNGITIWNGSKEDNCIRYGQGEKWCITRGSYGNYRYSAGKGYPTFYLAKNANLSDSDKLSFVAIQVRDADEDERYVYTNRQNSPHESQTMSFSELTSNVPWLNDIPNIKGILKHIPLSSTEKVTQLYRGNSIGIREWMKLPFEAKKQYLVVRKDRSELFEDVTNSEFVSKYLPKYPQIANFVAITPGIIINRLLLANLDKFDNQDRKSIITNLRDKVSTNELKSDNIPFDAKKLLVYLDKWELSSNERLYVTKDGSTIVRLKLGNDISVGLYQAEDDYPNIKLNKRTSKYLLDYPELDKIPLKNLIKLSDDGAIDKNIVKKVLDNAKADPNSAIAVKDVDGKEIVIDSNSFASYQVDQNGNLVPVAFNSEEVQKAFAEEKNNESFQQNAINLVRTAADERENLPATLDRDAFIAVLKAAPYDKRKVQIDGNESIILPLVTEDGTRIVIKRTDKTDPSTMVIGGTGDNWRRTSNYFTMDESTWGEYFAYMRNENQVYSDDELLRILKMGYGFPGDSKVAFIKATPPLNPTGRYNVAYSQANDTAYIVNKQNPRESFKVSDRSGKLVKANVPPSLSRQLTGATPDEATPTAPGAQFGAGQAVAAPIAGRRGRPAGVPNAPRDAAPAAPEAGGGVNVTQRMQEAGLETSFLRLPRNDYRRLAVTNAASILPSTDRGAARRNNQLGTRGRVTSVLSIGASKIYFIRMQNGTNVASINVQPGNRNYLLTGNEQGNVAQALNSPSELLQALRDHNLAEMRSILTQEYLMNNPEQLEEVRGLIQQHIAETRNN